MTEAGARPAGPARPPADGQGSPGTTRPRSRPPTRPRSRYLEILRTPGALSFSVAGAIGRMPMAMFGLGTVLLVAATTGRYGPAGLVAAAGALGYAGLAPQIARLAESLGQGRVLRPLAVVFAVTTVIFITTVEMGAPL
jgi:hypothetical protein